MSTVAPPAPLPTALTPSPPPVAPPAPWYPTLPVSALPVSRILALKIAFFASPQPGGMQARIEALET
jgi:hypothetical protein